MKAKIKCSQCRYVRPDKKASDKDWTAYECGNCDSEHYKSLLNVSAEGNKLKHISWGGCTKGKVKV